MRMLVAEEENVEDGEGVVRPSKEIWPQAQWNQVYLSFFLYLYLYLCICMYCGVWILLYIRHTTATEFLSEGH